MYKKWPLAWCSTSAKDLMWIKRQNKDFFIFQMLSYLNTLDVAPPFESMLNPFCCRGFLRVVHHHKRLNVFMLDFYFPLARRYVTNSSIVWEPRFTWCFVRCCWFVEWSSTMFIFGKIIVNIAIYGLNWRRRAKKGRKNSCKKLCFVYEK